MERLPTTHKKIKDPVCGMAVDPSRTDLVAIFNGKNYYFCAEGCRRAFEKKPEKHIKRKSKGWWGRYLDRLARANEKAFGPAGSRCH